MSSAASATSPQVFLYFHANAVDIGLSIDFLNDLVASFQINAIAIEYPGYGIYDSPSSESTIQQDAVIVYDFLLRECGYAWNDIILFGHSLGSSPALFLSTQRPVACVVLLSPFVSMQTVVKDHAPKWMKGIMRNQYDNKAMIKCVFSPIIILHGKGDALVPVQHAIDLFQSCQTICDIAISETMTHNFYSFISDITNPVKRFLGKIDAMKPHTYLPKCLQEVQEAQLQEMRTSNTAVAGDNNSSNESEQGNDKSDLRSTNSEPVPIKNSDLFDVWYRVPAKYFDIPQDGTFVPRKASFISMFSSYLTKFTT